MHPQEFQRNVHEVKNLHDVTKKESSKGEFSRKHSIISVFVLTLIMITGCSDKVEKTPEIQTYEEVNEEVNDRFDAKKVLTIFPDADIFQFNGVIYMTNIDWIEDLSLTKNIQIGEIKTKNDRNTKFIDEMSNKLPVGAKIFSVKERGDILIVESEGKILKYLAIVEG